jgi:hypothetical protein
MLAKHPDPTVDHVLKTLALCDTIEIDKNSLASRCLRW